MFSCLRFVVATPISMYLLNFLGVICTFKLTDILQNQLLFYSSVCCLLSTSSLLRWPRFIVSFRIKSVLFISSNIKRLHIWVDFTAHRATYEPWNICPVIQNLICYMFSCNLLYSVNCCISLQLEFSPDLNRFEHPCPIHIWCRRRLFLFVQKL